ncbi:hypothetical protein [Thermophilibacter sp.]
MGTMQDDLERCLDRARCTCEEGRVREAKRALLSERGRLLDELHERQRGIDAIDHELFRMGGEQR